MARENFTRRKCNPYELFDTAEARHLAKKQYFSDFSRMNYKSEVMA